MNYYEEIKNKIIDNEVYTKVKDYSKERYRVKTCYEIGKLLREAGSKYGERIIKDYSKKLTAELGKGYTQTRLRYYRRFYDVFEKCPTLSDVLSYSHYCEIIWLDIDEINYYIELAITQHLSVRQLRTRVKNGEYKRLPLKTKNKLIKKEKTEIKDLVPNPILIQNKNNIEIVNEKVLHLLILENISDFMEQLGSGYSFIKSEYKIKIGDRYNYIDILLFNIKFNAYVVVELKVTEFKVEYISQVQKYMNYIDKNVKEISNNNTIGIVICKKENKFMIEYCSDDRICIREYEVI